MLKQKKINENKINKRKIDGIKLVGKQTPRIVELRLYGWLDGE